MNDSFYLGARRLSGLAAAYEVVHPVRERQRLGVKARPVVGSSGLTRTIRAP